MTTTDDNEQDEREVQHDRATCPECGMLNVTVVTAPLKPPKMYCTNCQWDSITGEPDQLLTDGGQPADEIEHRPFETLKPYHDLAQKIEEYTAELGREAADSCRGLGWIALGGRSTANPAEVAETLEAISRNAESLAEQVRELDDPRELREVKYQ
jgi:hypothetical protein